MRLRQTLRLCSSTATQSAFASVANARARRSLLASQNGEQLSREFSVKAKKQPLI